MAKITSIQPTGQWQEFYKMEVSFDDGQKGTAFSKTQSPWYNVGDEVEYSLNAKGSLKISKGTASFGGGGGYSAKPQANGNKDEQIAKSVAFKGAIDLVSSGKIQISDIQAFVEKFTPLLTGTPQAPPQGATHAEHFPSIPF